MKSCLTYIGSSFEAKCNVLNVRTFPAQAQQLSILLRSPVVSIYLHPLSSPDNTVITGSHTLERTVQPFRNGSILQSVLFSQVQQLRLLILGLVLIRSTQRLPSISGMKALEPTCLDALNVM